MARIQDVTGECFKGTYDFIKEKFKNDEEILREISSQIYQAERNIMLELIKRDAVEQVLTERVMLYANCNSEVCDELTGKV